jgi:hypothetical protein
MKRSCSGPPVLLLSSLVVVFAPSAASATHLVVPDDYPSPAAALVSGASLGVDTVLVRSGRYTETTLSDLPGGGVMAGAVLYSGVYLLSHPDNAAAPVIDVGPGSDQVAIAVANDTDVTVDGFELPAGPRHSLEAYGSRATVRNCTIGAGLRATECPAILLSGNRITAPTSDAIFVQQSGLTLIANEVSGALTDAVTWVSTAGEFIAEDNTIHDNGGFGLVVSGTGVSADIRRNLIHGNLESGVFLTLTSSNAVLEENTIWMNGDVGVRATTGSTITVARNLIGRNQIGLTCESALIADCNDVWQNTVIDYEGPCGEHPTDFALDPEFCCTDLSCFTLQADSPCAPENSGGCGQVGARPVGCGAAQVEGATWGEIKSRFRR